MTAVERVLAVLEREGVPGPINDTICGLVGDWERTLPKSASLPSHASTCGCADCREPIVQGQRCPACASWSAAKIVTGAHGQNRECPDCTAQWIIR
jgi:hypothetical protein